MFFSFIKGAAALLKMHKLSGSCVTLPQHPDAYKAWFEDNLRMCIEYMEKVVQIRKTLLSFVPLKVTNTMYIVRIYSYVHTYFHD